MKEKMNRLIQSSFGGRFAEDEPQLADCKAVGTSAQLTIQVSEREMRFSLVNSNVGVKSLRYLP